VLIHRGERIDQIKKFVLKMFVLNKHLLCTEARGEGMFLTTEVFLLQSALWWALLGFLCNTLEGRYKNFFLGCSL